MSVGQPVAGADRSGAGVEFGVHGAHESGDDGLVRRAQRGEDLPRPGERPRVIGERPQRVPVEPAIPIGVEVAVVAQVLYPGAVHAQQGRTAAVSSVRT